MTIENEKTKLISIIPKPVKMTVSSGQFTLNNETKILVDENCRANGEYLKRILAPATGFNIPIEDSTKASSEDNIIMLKLDSKQKTINQEGYILKITQNAITLSAHASSGIFYGIQSLRQLFSENIETPKFVDNIDWTIPCVVIRDYPRFKWRGFMLDVGRHFFGREVIKQILDVMALLKMNVFHWHLTEDQGWRIEIKKYPKLISIGSKRKETQIGHFSSKESDGIPHEGYFTQDDIKEIISYATERFITIIPEIEMPGHSKAALASYPELSCSGGPFEVATFFGIHKDVYCAGKEIVFDFLQSVLDEIMNLFPSDIIHIGGDEVPKNRWKKCTDCQNRIKREGLKDENDLQVYFINRIAAYLTSHGRRVIGWNEILHDGLEENVIGQYWTGLKSIIRKHLGKGRNFVMSNVSHLYLDYNYKTISLSKFYAYDPILKRLEEQFHRNILGIEAPMWTEWPQNKEQLYKFIFPRLIAVAETCWTPKENKNFASFKNRLKSFLKRLDVNGINYAKLEEIK
ncbi:MAG: beta-N-acetylhexosaminidase [Candidatus Helarchaeota archaeon]|nr:beta-N-acetylhexosaminidase [Candidatus Helarchaeota archaeon]